MSKTVITFGTFDLFHVGHLRILQRARALGARLVVGVSTDALTFSKKQRCPVMDQESRKAILRSLRCVDHVFDEESLEQKAAYIQQHKASVFVMGDDWAGKFDHLGCIYLPRTPCISTTALIEKIHTTPGSTV